MRYCLIIILSIALAGCGTPYTTAELMRREVGHSVAYATLMAGNPDFAYDLPDGQRAFEWRLPRLVPEGGGECVYTARAALNGEPQSLAAWQIHSVEAQGPCAN
jgi:hypothetical protein